MQRSAPILATIILWSFPVTARGQDLDITDLTITDAVERELLHDRVVSSNLIDVETQNGIVTLTGQVDDILEMERSANICETVKGVRSVVNRIVVDPPENRSDEDVRADVMDALLYDPATDSYEVDASVDHGVVTLTGKVDSWKERQLCAFVVKGVRGVTGVKNEILASYDMDRPDSEIQKEIERSLQNDTLVDDALVNLKVTEGRVKLSGIVGSAAEKRMARYLAWTAGVTSVEASDLEVARWARDDDLRKSKYAIKSDDEIYQAVREALRQDPRVSAFSVTPGVTRGTVTLRGIVDNLKAKRAAERDARRTVGVVSVENHLKVRPAIMVRNDRLARRVRDALERDPVVNQDDVSVAAHSGTVILSGEVNSWFEKGQADDVASRVNGVLNVVNNIEVEDHPLEYDPYVDDWYIKGYEWYRNEPVWSLLSDAEIAASIRQELWWSPYVNASEISISVQDGIATLTGTVDTFMEQYVAQANAYQGGATYVRNQLAVE